MCPEGYDVPGPIVAWIKDLKSKAELKDYELIK